MTATLHYTQGLPGAGKTTYACRFAAAHDAVYVSADEIRMRLYGRRYTGLSGAGHVEDRDPAMCRARDTAIFDGLRADRDVIVDGTNLTASKVRHLAFIADVLGADLRCHDLTDVPVDVCVARALEARGGVDDGVVAYIYALHARHLAPAEVAA